MVLSVCIFLCYVINNYNTLNTLIINVTLKASFSLKVRTYYIITSVALYKISFHKLYRGLDPGCRAGKVRHTREEGRHSIHPEARAARG